jgi:Frag1/DRAM/Sfk1 family
MPRFLPVIAAILPFAGVTAAYWLNVEAGVLPSCIPYLEGCTSISATGRYPPGSLVFRAALLPQAALLCVLWWLAVEWLKGFGAVGLKMRRTILVAGVVGAIALVIYVTFLGSKHPVYEFMRRFGIYFYFLGSALAQLLLTVSMTRSKLQRLMLAIIVMPFVLGIANLLVKLVITDTNAIENTVEWISALLMHGWFMLLFVAWRRSGLTVTVRSDSSSAGL